MSKAQQNKNYIAELKAASKYDAHKQNRAAKMRMYRQKKKNEENEMPLEIRADVIAKRRAATRESVQKCRQRKRAGSNDAKSVASQDSTTLSDLSSVGYSSIQTLGKAVRKATRALPISPTRKRAVLARMIFDMNEADRTVLAVAITSPPPKTKSVPNVLSLRNAIREFYEHDDISRVSPKIRDVKEYVCPETGDKILLATRHMILTCKEACAVCTVHCSTQNNRTQEKILRKF